LYTRTDTMYDAVSYTILTDLQRRFQKMYNGILFKLCTIQCTWCFSFFYLLSFVCLWSSV